jgi:ATP-dependent DNA helicase 2 subunit 1
LGSDVQDEDGVLGEGASITRINDLLSQMRFHEAPKRSLFSLPLKLAEGFTIGVKGYVAPSSCRVPSLMYYRYGLVTEQKKGAYKYFVDLGDRMEMAQSKTSYIDQVCAYTPARRLSNSLILLQAREAEVDKAAMLFGMELGATAASTEGYGSEQVTSSAARSIRRGNRVFYTADEVRSFRTLGLEPGIQLLGFKDRSELAFEDNVKHSTFIFPDEGVRVPLFLFLIARFI